jgi:hypothetical protein
VEYVVGRKIRLERVKREDVTGDWRRLNSDELYGFTAYQILYG